MRCSGEWAGSVRCSGEWAGSVRCSGEGRRGVRGVVVRERGEGEV